MVRITSIGIGSHEGYLMEPFAAGFRGEGYDVQLRCADAAALDEDLALLADFVAEVRRSDFLIVHMHGDVSYFRHWESVRAAAAEYRVSTFMTGCEEDLLARYRPMFLQSDEDFRTLRRLQAIGGDDNQRSTLIWCLDAFDGAGLEVPEPVVPPAQGVYAPGRGARPLEEGLRDVGGTGRPVVGIFFASGFYIKHNTAAVDVLWEEIERAGGEPVAIFFSTYADDAVGSIGLRRIVDEHLVRGGRPVLDCVVNTMGFSLTVLADPGSGEQKAKDAFLERLGVPVLQAISLYGPAGKWRESPFGLSPADIAMSVVGPEYDGQIDTVPYCGTEMQADGDFRQAALGERCSAIAEMAVRWAMLRRTAPARKKVAVIVYMYPPRQDLAGGGYGLDTHESVARLLRAMAGAGYSLDWIPEDGREVANRLLQGVTNDDSWMSEAQVLAAAAGTVPPGLYGEWFSRIPESAQKRFVGGWGEPPGDRHVVDGEQLLPGIINGNVFIGFQPDRGRCTAGAYHDPWAAPPHQYLGFYRWLKEVWGADAVVHIGTHGTLEWLPGKSAGLSGECDPDIVLGRLPNVNPYIIDNPGEGMQSKRRQYAVTTAYLHPAMARSGGYEEIDELESAVQAFIKARGQGQGEKLRSILGKIAEISQKLNMGADLGLEGGCTAKDLEPKVDALYDYVLEVKDAMIKDGLHVLGEVPEGQRLAETVYMLVRYRNGEVPSLRESVAAARGLDMGDLLGDPSGALPDGRLKGEASDSIDGDTFQLILGCQREGYENERCQAIVREMFPDAGGDLCAAVSFVCSELVPSIRGMGDEVGNVLLALSGGYVPPGPSGCPGRGRAQILPTGRNIYSIDPDGVPWHSSWEVGSAMAEQMVSRYLEDNGAYPRSVGVVLWATDTMKTGGDDVAYILKLMGLRPVWAGYGGRVKGLEVIPLEELGRPRVDVSIRISGLFRDTFPNLSSLIDDGVRMVAALDEDDARNSLAANVRRDTVEAIASGVPVDEARRAASARIFGDAPGTYGCGISDMVGRGDWSYVGDLAAEYVKRGSSIYGRGLAGESRPDLFRRRLGGIDVVVKNHNTRAVDMLDMDDDIDCLGGFSAAVESERGEKPASYMGDSSDMRNPRLRTTAEEVRFIWRSKVDNPKWLEGLRRHGFAGAKELSKLFDYTNGWSATERIIEGWQYDDLAERFVLDGETREWIKDENPYAMIAMLRDLEEARRRGYWDPADETVERLKSVYLEFEERIEEITDRR